MFEINLHQNNKEKKNLLKPVGGKTETNCLFSRALHRSHGFPRVVLFACFHARALYQLHVFLRFSPVTYFPGLCTVTRLPALWFVHCVRGQFVVATLALVLIRAAKF